MSHEIKKVSIVIPAYNEEKAIGKTLELIKNTIEKIKGYDFEIIVVDNNSSDSTGKIAKSLGAKVVFERNKGYGNAYKKGLKEAGGDIIITGDADGTYPFEDIPKFLQIIEKNNVDFINTDRFANLEKNSMPFINYIGNKVLTFLINMIYNVNIKDSQSGMWIFKREVIEKMNFDIMSEGMPFSQEIKLYAIYLGFKFLEIPITYRKRIGKKKLDPVKDGIDNFINLLKFRKKLKSVKQ
ncbi:glycosyl transferase family 2 [Methanocaldococcus vulcanius M7]|uniref:Glycosyl transferase family 2 n=1 Tax=Methanocaldococcus vulcanius (strain ATCC 700851 / DSM 12094 / M7) TaxID=579137 RepID=C9RER1_METVM|nr:glycosyltransferase family 2 protein [Methanocaldococcus vulcanius]ACX72063.1 glycosyl transferase family 2 [Methanocaldococcus vulcanius M7]